MLPLTCPCPFRRKLPIPSLMGAVVAVVDRFGAVSCTMRLGGSVAGAVRRLHVHEHDAMELLRNHGITTPACHVASTPDEARHIFSKVLNDPATDSKDVYMKAQVLSCGRKYGTFQNGFEGGVQVVNSSSDAQMCASRMLGQLLKTKQVPTGLICNKVLLMKRLEVKREMFFSIIMDRESQGPLMIASPRGGDLISDVANANPEIIFTQPVDIVDGVQDIQCARMANYLGLNEGSMSHAYAVQFVRNMYNMFIACDCTQLETNPVVETPDSKLAVCDVKVSFDENAAFRHPSIFGRRDRSQGDIREAGVSRHGVHYIGLDGSIGCIVNGAGLAMATMDMIKMKGGCAANFMDVGGSASEVQVQQAFSILNSDSRVEVILINIFGGILRCDTIASAIVNAAKELCISKPLVLRLQGTNEDTAKILLSNSGVEIILASDLDDAASKAVNLT